MLGFLGRFGRSRELRRLDDALRAVDLHPALVPEAVKLTIVRLLRQAAGDALPYHCAMAAELVAYCMLGGDAFAQANDAALAGDVEARIDAALAAGDSLDARLVLLTLHAGVVQPEVIRRFGLRAD